MLRPKLDAISAQTIQIYGWLRCPFRRFHMCRVCFIAVHIVKKPNPSVNPQVIDMIDKSVSLETWALFSMRFLTTRRDDMTGNVQALKV